MNTQVELIEGINIEEINKQPWWNRPLWGKRSFLEFLLSLIDNRKRIPQQMINRHDQAWQKSEILTATLRALLSDSFSAPDFLIFARINLLKYFEKNNQYFNQVAEIIQIIIKHLDSLSILGQVEIDFQQDSLQELYQFTENIVTQKLSKLVFQEKLRKQKELILSNLSTTEEERAVKTYVKKLYIISEYPRVLELYFFLKRHELDDWGLLNKLGNFIKNNNQNNLQELKAFVLIAKANDNWFKNLEQALGFFCWEEDSVAYAKILQYLALSYKYESLYPQFQRFLAYLGQWEKTYYYILCIREKYSTSQYHHPKTFKQNIPGFDIYKIYHDYLDSSYVLKQL